MSVAIDPLIKRVLIAGWSTGLGLGVTSGIVHILSISSTHRYVESSVAEALKDPQVLSVTGGNIQKGLWNRARISSDGNRATSRVKLIGDDSWVFLHIAARRSNLVSKVVEDDFDTYIVEGSGFKHFWDHPWEVKILLIQKYRAIIKTINESEIARAFKTAKQFVSDVISPGRSLDETKNNSEWEVTNILVAPNDGNSMFALKGESNGHPFYEKIINSDFKAKDGKSRTRWYTSLGIVSLVFTGYLLRKRFYFKQSASESFAKSFVKNNPVIKTHFGGSVNNISFDGVFADTLINGSIYFKSRKGPVKVIMQAFRDQNKWRVARASLETKNSRLPIA